jgi:L-alanine-DL-glutamate epimerase-like enolase superfamily enzyme
VLSGARYRRRAMLQIVAGELPLKYVNALEFSDQDCQSGWENRPAVTSTHRNRGDVLNMSSHTLSLEVTSQDLPLKAPFRISGMTWYNTPVVFATVRRGPASGRGEAAGVYYTGDSRDKAVETLRQLATRLPDGLSRDSLQGLLPAGGARNALDCALWELESQETGRPVWALAGLGTPRDLLTTMTLPAQSPADMAQGARGYATARALKVKLTGDVEEDVERVRAIRAARKDVWLGVDANQGYAPDTLARLLPTLVDCGVKLLEQPFRRGSEAQLDGLKLPIPVAADESCLDLQELEALPGRFEVVNIKLDKCGGLTEGLKIARRAQALGLKVMVGNMIGTSISMGPAFVLGQLCDIVDLDGPIFITHDPEPTVRYHDGYVSCPPQVWGGGRGERRGSATAHR